ncbi:MAG TPA: hypothetical protein VMH35_16465 [Streptosporangiaceae bacterium]|nr:hypothetical protein [Streptosporangiaceae bacterium]
MSRITGGAVLAALPRTGWSSRLDLDRVAPAVRTAALARSRQLGPAAQPPVSDA